ncbi:MAG: hypothetical protein K2I75_05450 [Clostridiales bacterium]|nr:hypothetical protein [Clostridiales bacterium]
MFLSALQPYVVLIIIAAVLLQYAFAVFCLLKLAYMDFDKKKYILWNLLILIVFYIGGVVFLVYYNKHPELRISKEAPTENNDGATDEQKEDNAEDDEPQSADEQKQEDTAEQEQPAEPQSENAEVADGENTDTENSDKE